MKENNKSRLGAMKKSLFGGVMALGILVVLAPAARASLVFDSTNGLCCFEVSLQQTDATDVFVNVTLTGGATAFVKSGSPFPTNHPGFGFNLAGAAITDANIVSPVNLDTFHVGSGTTSPDFGTFAYYFDIPDHGSSGGDAGPLQFTVSRASGVLISDFGTNAAGYFFVADILDAAGGTGLSAINTPGTSGVPEPMSVALVGGGLLGLGLFRKRFSA